MPRLASGVATSRCAIRTGAAMPGLMPRLTTRSTPRCWLYCSSAARTRLTGMSRVVARAVVDQLDLGAAAAAPVLGEVRRDPQHHVVRLRAHRPHRHPSAPASASMFWRLQMPHQVGRVLGADHRQLPASIPAASRALLLGHAADAEDHRREQQRHHQQAEHHACGGRGTGRAVPCAPPSSSKSSRQFMRAGPLPSRSAWTKASSRLSSPVCARSSSGVPAARTSPLRDHHDAVAQRGDLLHDVAGEDHAAAFAAQLPQEVAQAARGHHVEAVGRLVEDHVARARAPARARSRSWCAGPARSPRCGGRGSPACRASSAICAVRSRDRRRIEAVQLAEVADVLARGQALVDAARVRQHAEALRAPASASSIASKPSTRTLPWSGDISVYSMRSVVVLPAPFGPSRPVISPSRAVKLTPRTACTGRSCP